MTRGTPTRPRPPRIGILVVAYNAGSTIQALLDRIPPATWEKITEVFIFDDARQDDTCERAAIYRESPRAENRWMNHLIETGRLPWEWTADPALQRHRQTPPRRDARSD